MKKLCFLLLVLLVAVWLGLQINTDPGYVLLAYQHWTIEMPLWLAVSCILALFMLLHAGIGFINRLKNVPQTIHHWHLSRKQHKSRQQTINGFLLLTQGHWQKAQEELTKSARVSKTPLLNYLGAAMAAQEQGLAQERDDFLRYAHQSAHDKDAEVAIGLTQAKLQLENDQLEQCCATLKHMEQLNPDHEHIAKLLQKVYTALQDWPTLLKHLERMLDQKFITKKTYEQQIIPAAVNHFNKLIHARIDFDKLQLAWSQLPRLAQYHQDILTLYIPQLLKNEQPEVAEKLCRESIKKNWHYQLVKLYGTIDGVNTHKQLNHAESWLKQHPHSSSLLLTLGRLCIKLKLWGKAEQYLKQSLNSKLSDEVYFELGKLSEQNNDLEQSKEYFYQGLQLATQR